MTSMSAFDVFFLSYDEPHAEKHYVDLLDKCRWADRIHGVKGFNAVHRAAAEASSTDWFVTVDADNIVDAGFFDYEVDLDRSTRCLSFNGRNMVNGLCYGNGGLKLWSKAYVLAMRTHEDADDPRKAVDFCWEHNYRQIQKIYSQVWTNGSPYQSFRVGYREGVKLSLNRGERVEPAQMKEVLHPQNMRNLRIWCCVGSDMMNGIWGIYGARLGFVAICDSAFDHTVVRDYEWFTDFWKTIDQKIDLEAAISDLGAAIRIKTGIALPLYDSDGSAFFREMIQPVVNLSS